MKRITVKGLADFMSARPLKQREIVRSFKFPKEDDGRAKIMYYREARSEVCRYHRNKYEPTWIRDQAKKLAEIAGQHVGPTRTRLTHNSRALSQYAEHFSNAEFDVLEDVRMEYRYGDVIIAINPDLHVLDRGHEKLVKCEFGSKPLNPTAIQVVTQITYEAAISRGLPISSTGVVCLEVSNGATHKGGKIRTRLKKEIAAACQNFSAIWDDI